MGNRLVTLDLASLERKEPRELPIALLYKGICDINPRLTTTPGLNHAAEILALPAYVMTYFRKNIENIQKVRFK